jgi:hypothetical protein
MKGRGLQTAKIQMELFHGQKRNLKWLLKGLENFGICIEGVDCKV